MRVQTTDLGEVLVSFTHYRHDDTIRVTKTGKKKAKEDTFTECIITVNPTSLFSLREYIGASYLNPEDRFDKEEGRKISLTRALDEMIAGEAVSKKTSREVWVGYYSR